CRCLEKKQVIKEYVSEEIRKEEASTEEVSMTEEVLVNPTFPFQLVVIGGGLSETCKSQLKLLLKGNIEVFALELTDMTGVPCRRSFTTDEKVHLEPPVPHTPWFPKETLYAYLAISKEAAPMEKLALSLIHMTMRLLWYFEAHPVKVITDQPIKQILNKTKVSGKLEKYTVEIGAYNITFETRNAVKGQGSGAGLVLIGPSGVEYTYALRLTFTNTNNEAEYEALLAGLRIARSMKIQNLEAKVDSILVASQINGSYVANSDSMIKYLAKAKEYIACFKSFSIKNIPRNLNQKADMLGKIASMAFNHLPKEILVKVLNERSTKTKEINTVIEEEGDN
ncbi:reverse transcriptase domain-containing protein, partial [Tanacetum coccineum]